MFRLFLLLLGWSNFKGINCDFIHQGMFQAILIQTYYYNIYEKEKKKKNLWYPCKNFNYTIDSGHETNPISTRKYYFFLIKAIAFWFRFYQIFGIKIKRSWLNFENSFLTKTTFAQMTEFSLLYNTFNPLKFFELVSRPRWVNLMKIKYY